MKPRKPHRRRGRLPTTDRKDYLIQTRVPEGLDNVLKDEARKRRVTVSQLIRNVLHDSFELVDNVVANVDGIVNQSVQLARTVSSDAQRVAAAASGLPSPNLPKPPQIPSAPSAPLPQAPAAPAQVAGNPFGHIYGWQKLIMAQEFPCAHCGKGIGKGTEGLRGQSDEPGAPRTWLHIECLDKI